MNFSLPHTMPQTIRFSLKSYKVLNVLFIIFSPVFKMQGACVGAVGTALQAGRPWVRFPMLSMEFVIDIILPAAL